MVVGVQHMCMLFSTSLKEEKLFLVKILCKTIKLGPP